MPIEFEEPQSILISENFKPSLTLTFSRELTNQRKTTIFLFCIWSKSARVNMASF